MSKAIDSIKFKTSELARLLVKTSKNEEELTERVVILLTQKHNLEAEKAELIEFIEEIQSNYSIYTYEDFTAWSNKFDYYKLQKEN